MSMVTLDHGQPDGRRIDGISVYKSYRPDAGVPGIRFVTPRITRLWAAMSRADADVYYQRTSDSISGVVSAFCRVKHRHFIFALGATADCQPSLPNCPTVRERLFYLFGLRRADRVIAQTEWQCEQLRQNFGVEASVVRGTAADPGEPAIERGVASSRRRFLWVGRFCREKRPELIVELARRCVFAEFQIIGGGGRGDDTLNMERLCQGVPNLHLQGYIPHDCIGQFYAAADALVCTSETEGFPNTFLEAWSRGVPVVTTFDPDGTVASHGVGIFAPDVSALAYAVERIATDACLRNTLARNAREYYRIQHAPMVVLDQFENILRALPDVPSSVMRRRQR